MQKLIDDIRAAGYRLATLDGYEVDRWGMDYILFSVPGTSVHDEERVTRIRDFCRSQRMAEHAQRLNVKITWQTTRGLVKRRDNSNFPTEWQDAIIRDMHMADADRATLTVMNLLDRAEAALKDALRIASEATLAHGDTITARTMSRIQLALGNISEAILEEDN